VFVPTTLRRALQELGSLLAFRKQSYTLAIVGGGGLQLLGLIARPTRDLDVIAVIVDGKYQTAEPLPVPLRDAVVDVAHALGLAEEWLNSGPTQQLRFGLPAGFGERVVSERFGALTVHLASRYDQICLKLHAAVDDGPSGKHAADLRILAPTRDELAQAAVWVKGQDSSDDFVRFVDQVIEWLGGTNAR
jgi:hypothetical protein